MDNVLHMIGMTNRAGRLKIGEEPVGEACQQRSCRLVLVARDAAENTFRRVRHFAEAGQCLWITIPYTKEELGSVTGRHICAMVAVTEIGMALAIAKLLAQEDSEQYGAIVEKLEVKAQRAMQRRQEQRSEDKSLSSRGKAKKPYVPTRIKRAQKEQQRK